MSKWIPYIIKALDNLGGEAKYSDIYNEFEKVVSQTENLDLGTKTYKGKPVWQGVLRREIQQHSSYSDAYIPSNKDIFFPSKGLGKGVWALYDSSTLKKTKSFKKNIWIEKTYFKHPKAHSSRNEGERALGKAIWSPEFGKDGRESYKNIRMVSKGDIILHLINNSQIIGFSEVSSNEMQIIEGVEDTDWEGRRCLWELKSFTEFEKPIIVKDFLSDSSKQDLLNHIRELGEVFYTKNNNLRQGAYLTPVSQEFLVFLNLIYQKQINSDFPFYDNFIDNLSIVSDLDLIDHIEHNTHDIVIKNKHFISDKKKVNLSENHNNLVVDIIKGLKDDLNFEFVEEVKMGKGDIDIVVSHESTLIFLEIKTGAQSYLSAAFPNFNGKKDKWFKYMSEKYMDGKFKKKFNKTVHIYVPNGEIEDIKDMRSRFIDEGTLDINKVKKSNHTITCTEICHPDKLETYFKVGRKIDKEYGKRDFLKDFNISPDADNKMLVPAFKILRIDPKDGGKDHEVLLFTCSARRFLKFASVSRRSPGDPKSSNVASYQRMLDGNRIKDIAKDFINDGGYFPNNILVKLNEDKIKFKPLQKKIRKSLISDSEMELMNKSTEFNSEYGLLEIFDDYHSAWVIDGQHRLFSYLKASDNVLDNVNIAGLVGLSPKDEINYFVNINDKAKPVSKDLIWDLNGEIDSDSIEGIVSNICKRIDKKLLRNPRKKAKPGDEFKIKKQLNIPSRRDKGRSFQGLCRTFLNDNRFRNYSKPEDNPLHRTVNRWTYVDSTEQSYKRIINPFFKNKKNSDKIVKSTSNAYVSFFKKLNTELLNNVKADRDILKELYVSDGMLSVMFRMAQHYFNFHKKDVIINDHFFESFASSILKYTENDLKNMSSSTASEKGKTSVEYNFTLDIMNIHGYNHFRKEKPTRLIGDVFDLVENEMDKSFGELIYKIIKQKYNINFVYGHQKYRKDAANLLKNGFMGRNVNNSDDLYKLCGITDMITSICLKGSASPTETVKLSKIAPEIVNNGTPKEIEKALVEAETITISPWKEFFERIISPQTKSSIGFTDHEKFMNALNILTKYRNDTHGHTKRDIYHPKVRKIVEANYEVMRDLVDKAYDDYDL